MVAPAVDTVPETVDALVVGSAFLDVVLVGIDRLPNAGEERWAHDRAVCAGGVANTAIALARLGRGTSLATAIGNDVFGGVLLDLIREERSLDTDLVVRVDAPTPFTVAVGNGDDRSFLSHGDLHLLDRTDVLNRLPSARVCFVSLQPEPAMWLDRQRVAGGRVVAGLGFDERHGWSHTVLEQLTTVDVLVCNELEAMSYGRETTVDRAAAKLADRVPVVVVTRGAAGAIAIDARNGTTVTVDGVPAAAIDATGAGDAFVAGVMDAMLRDDVSLEQTIRHAALVAALAVEGIGGSGSAPSTQAVRARAARIGDPAYAFEFEWADTPDVPPQHPTATTPHKGEIR